MLGLFYFHTDRPALFLFLAVDSGSVRGQRGSVRGQGGCVATKSVNDWSGIGPPYCFSNLHNLIGGGNAADVDSGGLACPGGGGLACLGGGGVTVLRPLCRFGGISIRYGSGGIVGLIGTGGAAAADGCVAVVGDGRGIVVRRGGTGSASIICVSLWPSVSVSSADRQGSVY